MCYHAFLAVPLAAVIVIPAAWEGVNPIAVNVRNHTRPSVGRDSTQRFSSLERFALEEMLPCFRFIM